MSAVAMGSLSEENLGRPFWNRRTETMARDRLDALHLARLQKLVAYAYENSAFYRRKFDAAGVKPADICSLDDFKRRIAQNYSGGPVGVETLAAALAEERDTIEDVIEPFLIQQGLIQRTPRGRMATLTAYRHFGIDPRVTLS